MLQDLATPQNNVCYKGETATIVTTMMMEYGDEMKLYLQDLIGLPSMTL
jgi:hypothetical protein